MNQEQGILSSLRRKRRRRRRETWRLGKH